MTEQEKQQMRARIEANYREAKESVKPATYRISGTNISRSDARKEMAELDKTFLKVQKEYYANKCTNENVMQITTQPFWQSMRLNQNRLKKKGLSCDMDVEVLSPGYSNYNGLIVVEPEGNFICGGCTREIMVQRTFYAGGKPVFHRKNKELNTVSYLKSRVEGDLIACPNCGALGSVASYIDGCDYCGSKFTVHDFEAKVSGFSTEEAKSSQAFSAIRRLALILAALSAILTGLFTYFLFLTAPSDISFSPFSSYIISLVLLGILCLIGLCVLNSEHGYKIMRELPVKQMISDFSPNDFYQNLEYKLRSIHLADSTNGIRTFATIPLDSIIAGYQDVIDCNLLSLTFQKVQESQEQYELTVSADMKLMEYHNQKMDTHCETIVMSLHSRKSNTNKKITALREYQCPNCGSSIDIFEGSICKSCGTAFDYSNYDWMIDCYESKRKRATRPLLISLGLAAIYLILLLIQFILTYLFV